MMLEIHEVCRVKMQLGRFDHRVSYDGLHLCTLPLNILLLLISDLLCPLLALSLSVRLLPGLAELLHAPPKHINYNCEKEPRVDPRVRVPLHRLLPLLSKVESQVKDYDAKAQL